MSDLGRPAKRVIPAAVFDYVDAADEELAAVNVAAFRRWRFLPRMPVNVGEADTATTVESPVAITRGWGRST